MAHPERPQIPTPISPSHTLKGCIHWFDFVGDPDAKTIKDIHPCIIIGKDNPNSSRVIISPISDATNYIKKDGTTKYLFHVLLKKDTYTFLEKDSVILLDQVLTIPKNKLFEEWYMGKIQRPRQIDEGIMQNYDLISTFTELLHETIDEIMKTKQA